MLKCLEYYRYSQHKFFAGYRPAKNYLRHHGQVARFMLEIALSSSLTVWPQIVCPAVLLVAAVAIGPLPDFLPSESTLGLGWNLPSLSPLNNLKVGSYDSVEDRTLCSVSRTNTFLSRKNMGYGT